MLFVNYSSARVTYLLQTRNIRIFMISRICTIPFVWNVLVEISFYDFTRGVAENISLLELQYNKQDDKSGEPEMTLNFPL